MCGNHGYTPTVKETYVNKVPAVSSNQWTLKEQYKKELNNILTQWGYKKKSWGWKCIQKYIEWWESTEEKIAKLTKKYQDLWMKF